MIYILGGNVPDPFCIGVHNEWNVDRPSNFPTTSRNGNDVGTDGLRETYVGITWWIKP